MSRSPSSRPTPRSRVCGSRPARTSPRRALLRVLELDLSTVVPSIAGPKRPQDRIALTDAKNAFRKVLPTYVAHHEGTRARPPASRPATRPPRPAAHRRAERRRQAGRRGHRPRPALAPRQRHHGRGHHFEIDHGIVSIASITSCTNTSNPSVMMAAAMVAKNAVDRGLTVARGSRRRWRRARRWSPTTTRRPACGPTREARLPPGRLRLHDLHRQLRAAQRREISRRSTTTTSPWSRCSRATATSRAASNPDVKMNYLASPPLVIAYALAGTMDFDFETEPLGTDSAGTEVFLKDLWPAPADVERTIADSITRRCSPATTPTSSPVTSAGSPCPRREARPSSGTGVDLRPQAPVLRGHADGDHPVEDIPAQGCSPSWATRSPPTTSAPPARSRRTALRARTSPSTASTARTSTPTARAAATTRS